MYEPIARDLAELTKRSKGKRRKRMDVKVVQDFQLAQMITKEAMSRHSNGNVVINIFNRQTSSVQEPVAGQEEIETGDISMIEVREPVPERPENSDGLHDLLEKAMELLPRPKRRSLDMALHGMAYEKFGTTREMAEWLGVERSSVYHWIKKMGRLPPSRGGKGRR